jgi:hypothetical protein
VNKFRAKRADRDEDWQDVLAADASWAAVTLIEQQEAGRVEFPIASGHESAEVEIEGHGRFEVFGNPSPHYFARRR